LDLQSDKFGCRLHLSISRRPFDKVLTLIDHAFHSITAGLMRSKRFNPAQIRRQPT
jgi:hypothetical protein